MPKPLTMWITIKCGKFWKRWGYQTTWPASWEICMQVKKQQVELDMEQQTGSKLGKEYVKAVYRHLAYLTHMQSQFSSVAQSCPTLCDPPPCPSPTPGVHLDSCPSSQWCHPAISSSVIPFFCPQSLPASKSFPMSQLFSWSYLRLNYRFSDLSQALMNVILFPQTSYFIINSRIVLTQLDTWMLVMCSYGTGRISKEK